MRLIARLVISLLLLSADPAFAAISGTVRGSVTDGCSSGEWGGASCQVDVSGIAGLAAGDLIVVSWSLAFGTDLNEPTAPSGFTLGPWRMIDNDDIACAVAWKSASGSETTITPTWTSPETQGGRITAAVFNGTDLNTTILEASNDNEANVNSATTSLSSGTASNATANALGVALLCTDNGVVNDVTAWSNSWVEQVEAGSTTGTPQAWIASKVLSSAASQSTTATITSDQGYGAILIFGGSVAGCPATCSVAPRTTGVCITNTAAANSGTGDTNNLLYYASGTVTANQDTLCYDATSDVLNDAVTVSTSGYVTLVSGGDVRTDTFTYSIMDNGAAAGAAGTATITQTPTLSAYSGTATGTTTADLAVTVAQVEGTCYAYVSTSATPPSVANHKSGGGSPAYHNADASCSAAQTWSATGLTAGTSYYAHFLQTNAATSALDSAQYTSPVFITTASGDTTPDAFEFGDLIDTLPATEYISNEVTITGIDADAVITVDGCEWRKRNGGPWGLFGTDAGVVSNNNILVLKITTSSEAVDSYQCLVTIGGVSDTWIITTALSEMTAARDFSEWFYMQEGYTGPVNTRMSRFLADQGYTGSLNSALFAYLRSIGYTGSLTTMIDAFERDVTIQHGTQ